MLSALVVMQVLSAAPAAAPSPMKLASPGFSYVNVDEKTGNLFAEYFARQLESHGLTVITPKEIAAVLGLERQKQLLGCSDDGASQCMAELGGALGVDAILTGSIGKVGSGFTVNLKLIDAKDASSLAVYSTRVDTEDAVLDWLGATAAAMADRLQPQAPVTLRERAWIPAVIGGGLAVLGGGALLRANAIHQSLVSGDVGAFRDQAGLDSAVSQGKTFQTAGVALLGAAAVGLIVSGGFYALGGPPEAQGSVEATAFLTGNGGGIVFGGRF